MATILIVDDDAAIRGVLYELFSEAYECHVASTAEEAFEYLEVEDYDAILTDVAMPGLSGVELLKRVQLRDLETPVILMSGKSREEDAKHSIDLGAFDYVTKPFKLDEIESTIQRAVAQKEDQHSN